MHPPLLVPDIINRHETSNNIKDMNITNELDINDVY